MMQTTRKWTHLGTDAKRLAGLGLSTTAIADQLGVNPSTVHRWRVAGKLGEVRSMRDRAALAAAVADAPTWAAAMRAAYQLDPTDAALVGLADLALSLTRNPAELPSVRLSAAARFQSLVMQLAGRLRPVEGPAPTETPARPTARVDPRALLNPTVQ